MCTLKGERFGCEVTSFELDGLQNIFSDVFAFRDKQSFVVQQAFKCVNLLVRDDLTKANVTSIRHQVLQSLQLRWITFAGVGRIDR